MDASFFGGAGVGVAPDGIESLAGVQTTTLAFSETGNLDPFAEAISLAENVGVLAVDPVTGLPGMSFVGNPADVLAVSTAKVADDSNAPLLGVDATKAISRSVLGVGLYNSPAVTVGEMWLVPRSKVFIVLRNDPEVIADGSAFFSSVSHRRARCAASVASLPTRSRHHPRRHRRRQLNREPALCFRAWR